MSSCKCVLRLRILLDVILQMCFRLRVLLDVVLQIIMFLIRLRVHWTSSQCLAIGVLRMELRVNSHNIMSNLRLELSFILRLL